MVTYEIPMRGETGKFKFDALDMEKANEGLLLCYDEEHELLTYDVPMYGNEARIYTVPKNQMPDELTIVYGDNGKLHRVELGKAGCSRLIYIQFQNDGEAKKCLLDFAEDQMEHIFADIIGRKQKLARLFLETFYDGESVEIAVRTATQEEMKAVIDAYRGEPAAADNAGDYPIENLIMFDNETLGVMLMCTDCDFQDELFEMAVETVEEQIRKRIPDKIEKTDDFQFILEEID